jgi:hypothetical protein
MKRFPITELCFPVEGSVANIRINQWKRNNEVPCKLINFFFSKFTNLFNILSLFVTYYHHSDVLSRKMYSYPSEKELKIRYCVHKRL